MKIAKKKNLLVGLVAVAVYTIPLMTIDGALFLKSQDGGALKGEVTTKGYEGWIAINSFQIGGGVGISSLTGGSTTRESTAPSLSEMTITKLMDKTSTGFFSGMTAGTQLSELLVYLPPASNPGRFIKIYLKDVLISGVAWSSGGEIPSESVSLNYRAIKIEHYTTDASGAETLTGSASWDLAKATANY